MIRQLITGLAIAAAFSSCGTVEAVKHTAANAGRSVKQFSLSDLRPSQIDIVEAREADLKEMPLGKEKAIAFEKERKRSFWSFSLPDFKEPSLPEVNDSDMDGSLLPPKPL